MLLIETLYAIHDGILLKNKKKATFNFKWCLSNSVVIEYVLSHYYNNYVANIEITDII